MGYNVPIMNFGTLNTNIIDIALYMALFMVLVLGIAMILKLTANHQKLEQLKLKKMQNKQLLEFICHAFDKIDTHMANLLNDMDVVHMYNITHIKQLETTLKYAETLNEYIDNLEDNALKEVVLKNLSQCNQLAQDIALIEKSAYETRGKHQEIVKALNRNYRIETIDDRDYIESLNNANANVKSLLRSYSDMRERVYENLKLYLNDTGELKQQIMFYKHKAVEQKRFYPRYVAFI